MMRIYDRDTEGVIGCVAPAVSPTHPPGVFDTIAAPYQLELRDRVAAKIWVVDNAIEQKLFPDPIHPGGRWMSMWGAKTAPKWLDEEDAELCGPVSGYRMSFRTDLIRKLGGFDERLGRYGMFEDKDVSIGALNEHMNVCAKRASIFHYRQPDQRVDGAEFGMMAILNRTYVVCKHAPPGSMVRRTVSRYLYYKIFRYLLQAYTRYGRERLLGAFYGLSKAQQLIDAPIEELSDRFTKLRNDFVEHAPAMSK
jgi:GT2 family glycosyltransferase